MLSMYIPISLIKSHQSTVKWDKHTSRQAGKQTKQRKTHSFLWMRNIRAQHILAEVNTENMSIHNRSVFEFIILFNHFDFGANQNALNEHISKKSHNLSKSSVIYSKVVWIWWIHFFRSYRFRRFFFCVFFLMIRSCLSFFVVSLHADKSNIHTHTHWIVHYLTIEV